MKIETKILLDEYFAEYDGYKNYLLDTPWIEDVSMNENGFLDSNRLRTELSIISTITKSTVKFIDDVGDDIDLKKSQDLLNLASEIFDLHISRLREYKKENPLDEYSNKALVEFHSKLFSMITSAKVALSKLNIGDAKDRKSDDLFFGDGKAPLMMREFLSEVFPIIKEKSNKIGINFNLAHVNPATSSEMFINMKERDIPKWDVNKHFYEQDKDVVQFWEEERRKIIKGVNINGYKISPWLYWHINHFKLAYGAGFDKQVSSPIFRDNEYFFDQIWKQAEQKGDVGIFMYGSRRWSKSVINSSKITHLMYSLPKAQGAIQGFSDEPDLSAILEYIGNCVEYLHPALKVPANSMNMKDGIVLGLKGKKAQDRFDFSRIRIINLESGSKKGSQKTAGITPDIWVMEEAAKGPMIAPWLAAIPSFAGGKNGKWRTIPIINGTAGEAELSKDAEIVLQNPEAYKILTMNWDTLDSLVDPEYITWKREKFGTFLPAQMSLGAPAKIKTNLAKFLKVNDKDLAKIPMEVTDWKAAKEFFESERNIRKGDIKALASFTNAYPMQVEDCYLSTKENIFPSLECKKRQAEIVQKGIGGQNYRLSKEFDEVRVEMVNDPAVNVYPWPGGNIDAPVTMLENPALETAKPPLGLYTMGVDDIKHSENKSSDSLFSATIFKRSFEGGEWANRFVAWYDTRPQNKKTAYKQAYLLMKLFNARVLYENNDNGFIEYVEDVDPEAVILHFSQGIGLASEQNLHRNNSRKYGWIATTQNIYHLTQGLVRYTKDDENILAEKENVLGVDLINHYMLLEEMIRYKPSQNADRLRSAGLALMLARYYDRTYNYMKRRKQTLLPNHEDPRKKKLEKFKTFNGLSNLSGLDVW